MRDYPGSGHENLEEDSILSNPGTINSPLKSKIIISCFRDDHPGLVRIREDYPTLVSRIRLGSRFRGLDRCKDVC